MANLNLNKTILGGKLTADAEFKTTPSGTSVTQFTLAINRRVNNGKNEADFINCVAWGKTAEFITKYFRKGSSLCIVGRIQTRSWEDQNGNKRHATEVIAEEAMFVDSKVESQPMNEPQSIPQEAPEMVELGDDEELPF